MTATEEQNTGRWGPNWYSRNSAAMSTDSTNYSNYLEIVEFWPSGSKARDTNRQTYGNTQ